MWDCGIVLSSAGESVNKADRLDRLRRAFRAAGGLSYVGGSTPIARTDEASRKPQGFAMFPDVGAYDDRTVQWVKERKAKPVTVDVKRTAKVSALTKIAEQLPAKLPRVLF
jgi:hypothetical protein